MSSTMWSAVALVAVSAAPALTSGQTPPPAHGYYYFDEFRPLVLDSARLAILDRDEPGPEAIVEARVAAAAAIPEIDFASPDQDIYGGGEPCPWDCTQPGDGLVGIADFLLLLAQWGIPGSCDIDGGGIGITDFLALLANWGPCQFGACCTLQGVCSIETEAACNATSSNCFHLGTSCGEADCPDRICTVDCFFGSCSSLCPCGMTAICVCDGDGFFPNCFCQ